MAGDTTNDPLESLVINVRLSPKYREISPELIRQIGYDELSRRKNLKEAIKETKRKLHQVGGAYLEITPNYDFLLSELTQAVGKGDPEEIKNTCRRILSTHASTAERLSILDIFYEQIFSNLPPISSILDLACGLNPVSLPWMKIDPSVTYYAWDIYQDMIAFINQVFRLFSQKGDAEVVNILSMQKSPKVDLAFILKTLPCIDQIKKKASQDLLKVIDARYMVITYPVRSLGGKDKGMLDNYSDLFQKMIDDNGWYSTRLEFASELAFIVRKDR